MTNKTTNQSVREIPELERVALDKLERLRQLWQGNYGKRFYHHTLCPPFCVNDRDIWAYTFPQGYTPVDYIKDAAKSILKHGLLSRSKLKENGLEVLTRGRLRNFVGNNVVSVYNDQMGSYYEEYGGSTITFIIDPTKLRGVESTEDNLLTEKTERCVYDEIPIDCVVGAYIATNDHFGKREPNYITQAFLDTLTEGFKKDPNKVFPIIWGTHVCYPIDKMYYNYEDVADYLTSDLYFPNVVIQRKKLAKKEIKKRREEKKKHNKWMAEGWAP